MTANTPQPSNAPIATIERAPRVDTRVRTWWHSRGSAQLRGTPGVLATYIVSRVLLFLIPLGLFVYPGGTLLTNDAHLYWTWSEVVLSGHYPIADPMWQYPPLAGFVFAIGANIASDPTLGFMLLALLADLVIFGWLLHRGRSTGQLAGAWTYAIAGLAIGPVLLTRFDVFPTLFAVAGLMMLSRPVRSGIMFGIGALLKVWPAFLLVAHPRRALPKAIAGCAAIAIAATMLLISWGPNAGSFLSEQGQRGLQIESVGGMPYVLANFFGVEMTTIFRYGSLEISAAGAGAVASVVALSGFALLGWLGYARLRGKLERVPAGDIALAVVLISIATSRVFSPQYMVWVAGIGAFAMLDSRTRMRPVMWLVLFTAIFGQLVYPVYYGSMIDGTWQGVLAQVARISLLVVATVWATVNVLRPDRYEPEPTSTDTATLDQQSELIDVDAESSTGHLSARPEIARSTRADQF
ncbi:MAG: glycosyltransferase family 87 protein [Candidatus Nanopelagicales bacterium]